MNTKSLITVLCIFVISCQQGNSLTNHGGGGSTPAGAEKTNPYASIEAIPLPAGFKRLATDSTSFASWLRKRNLKKDKTVYLFNGEEKTDQGVQFAVLDIPVGDKDLQQCADAVMRLRAEYLFDIKRYTDIKFFDNANSKYEFTVPYTKEHLYTFLEKVFGMCGSASLSKQLHTKNINDIIPGDVFIRGGFPGHAEIVMDVAVNDSTGKKIFLLAQSYMPAQDIHVLLNPRNKNLSPWYQAEEDIITPEYVFDKKELKAW